MQGQDRFPQPLKNERRHYLIMATLFFLLSSVYLMTYNARQVVNDELQALDAVTSLGHFGDNRYDESVWYVWDTYGPLGQDESLYPLPRSPFEQGIVWVAQPLYALAQMLPQLGTVHTLMLLNVFVSALAGVLMFQYVRLLGYTQQVAITAALLLGLATVLWPYSRTFLREPLTLTLLLLTAFLLEMSRHNRRWVYLIGAILALIAAYMVKDTALFALVGLPVILLRESHLRRRWLDGVLVLGVIIAVLLAFTDVFSRIVTDNVALVGNFRLQPAFFQEAFHSYIFSIGGSIWGVSPVLLLAVPGTWLLLRAGQRRYIWLMLLCVLGYAFAHAALTGVHWFGGSVWPSRFLIPMLPFMLIPALPAIEAVLKGRVGRIGLAAFGLLIIYSVWWQVTGASVWWYEYGPALPAASGGLSEWGPGLNQFRYIRPVLLTPVLLEGTVEFAWLRNDISWWPLLFGGVIFAAVVMLWRITSLNWVQQFAGLVLIAVVFAGGVFQGLRSIYADPQYLGDRESLHQIVAYLDEHEQPGDILLLNTPVYTDFFLNYGTFDHLRVVSLPVQPGAISTPGQASSTALNQLSSLLEPETPRFVNALSAERERLWLLMDSGPLIPGSLRPVEMLMQVSRYWLRQVRYTPADAQARLLEFGTVRAPTPVEQPETSTDLQFDTFTQLDGVTLPPGTTYQAGDILPVTLHLRALRPNFTVYRVAIFLADEGNNVVAQGDDSRMMGGFLPEDTWLAGEPIVDNRAMRLPDDLAPGTYRIWLRLYDFDEAGQVQTATVTGTDTIIDGDIAVLPLTITIIE